MIASAAQNPMPSSLSSSAPPYALVVQEMIPAPISGAMPPAKTADTSRATDTPM